MIAGSDVVTPAPLAQDYSVLFEPVRIGPVVSPNRFYQTPHGCGYGHREPSSMVEIRRLKAEGGWGVVCTEQVEIHPTSDMMPVTELRLWDDRDVPILAAVADAIHEHGALAAVELSHSGANTANNSTREVPIAPSPVAVVPSFPSYPLPRQARGMSLEDIREFRTWHRKAADRAVLAGFDIVYVYASSVLGLPNQFLSERFNRRRDDYGGSLRNRARLLGELIDDTRERLAGRCALAVRLTLDEFLRVENGRFPDLEELFGLFDDGVDLWDLTLGGMGEAAGSARFDVDAGRDRAVIKEVRKLSAKPVVAVGLFNDWPDMVALVQDGVVDLVGAARQSIADPFTPAKLRDGRADDVRACVRCNICVACDFNGVGVACTQNPTFGEEFRRQWHPERIPARAAKAHVAVVGAGPAGLECAYVLGRRGYDVEVFEARERAGGRVDDEAQLPGNGLIAEVTQWRLRQLSKMENAKLHLSTPASAPMLLAGGFQSIFVATGSRWLRDASHRADATPPLIDPLADVFTPNDVMDGAALPRDLVVYDDEHYYMGGLLAQLLRQRGHRVALVTPAAEASVWTHNTMEQQFVQRRLIELDVSIVAHRRLKSVHPGGIVLECVFTRRTYRLESDGLVLVTGRESVDAVSTQLRDRRADWQAHGLRDVLCVGDARAPNLIMHAVRDGHRAAREFDADDRSGMGVRREIPLPQARV